MLFQTDKPTDKQSNDNNIVALVKDQFSLQTPNLKVFKFMVLKIAQEQKEKLRTNRMSWICTFLNFKVWISDESSNTYF